MKNTTLNSDTHKLFENLKGSILTKHDIIACNPEIIWLELAQAHLVTQNQGKNTKFQAKKSRLRC